MFSIIEMSYSCAHYAFGFLIAASSKIYAQKQKTAKINDFPFKPLNFPHFNLLISIYEEKAKQKKTHTHTEKNWRRETCARDGKSGKDRKSWSVWLISMGIPSAIRLNSSTLKKLGPNTRNIYVHGEQRWAEQGASGRPKLERFAFHFCWMPKLINRFLFLINIYFCIIIITVVAADIVVVLVVAKWWKEFFGLFSKWLCALSKLTEAFFRCIA